MFLKKKISGAIAKFPLPGFGPARRQAHMLNIKVLVRTNDLRGLRIPAFAGRLRVELGARRVGCGIRNLLCG